VTTYHDINTITGEQQQQRFMVSICSTCVSWNQHSALEDFVIAKFYCRHVSGKGNECIGIREKTLQLSVVLTTQPLYHKHNHWQNFCEIQITPIQCCDIAQTFIGCGWITTQQNKLFLA